MLAAMSDTAARLQAYKTAELRILDAQQTRHGDRWRMNAELAAVSKTIKELESQLAAETAAASGSFGPKVMLADFSRSLG